jgi:hypothetical protein
MQGHGKALKREDGTSILWPSIGSAATNADDADNVGPVHHQYTAGNLPPPYP